MILSKSLHNHQSSSPQPYLQTFQYIGEVFLKLWFVPRSCNCDLCTQQDYGMEEERDWIVGQNKWITDHQTSVCLKNVWAISPSYVVVTSCRLWNISQLSRIWIRIKFWFETLWKYIFTLKISTLFSLKLIWKISIIIGPNKFSIECTMHIAV